MARLTVPKPEDIPFQNEWTREIAKRLDKAGISSTEMKLYPDDVKIPQATLTELRNGRIDNLTTKTIEKFCQLFQCQPKDLLKKWTVKLDENLSAKNIKKELKK